MADYGEYEDLLEIEELPEVRAGPVELGSEALRKLYMRAKTPFGIDEIPSTMYDTQRFHRGAAVMDRQGVLNRVAAGTKASSPQALAKRVLPRFMGVKVNPKSAGGGLFDQNFTQAYKPLRGSPTAQLPNVHASAARQHRPAGVLAPITYGNTPQAPADFKRNQVGMGYGYSGHAARGDTFTGGVLTNYSYAKMMIAQRARDLAAINALKEGLPVPSPTGTLISATEERQLQLNDLVQRIADAADEVASIDAGELAYPDTTALVKLIVGLAPTYTERELTALVDEMTDAFDTLETYIEGNPRSPKARQFYQFVQRVLIFLRDFARMNGTQLDERTKRLAITTASKKAFGLQPKAVAPILRDAFAESQRVVEQVDAAQRDEMERMREQLAFEEAREEYAREMQEREQAAYRQLAALEARRGVPMAAEDYAAFFAGPPPEEGEVEDLERGAIVARLGDIRRRAANIPGYAEALARGQRPGGGEEAAAARAWQQELEGLAPEAEARAAPAPARRRPISLAEAAEGMEAEADDEEPAAAAAAAVAPPAAERTAAAMLADFMDYVVRTDDRDDI